MTTEDVYGVGLDDETRCVHYGTDEDVVALRFGCCGAYYACFRCHEAVADHPPEPWPTGCRDALAVCCGVCTFEMTAETYMSADSCPHCEAPFNPGCAEHHHIYFEWVVADDHGG